MKTLKNILVKTKSISSVIVGVVFLFSGFVKGIDLLGSTYKFTDYFVAFGLPSLESLSLPLAFFLSASEFLIGVALIFRARMLIFSWISMLFMGFFTILTLVIAITNPVSDCGCFGDALIITNWETFLKNVILLLLVINVFMFRNKFRKFFPEPALEWGLLTIVMFVFISVSLYSYNHLPVFDFRPYHVGANIPEKMSYPPDAPIDEYEIILVYEKDGKLEEFTLDNMPDHTWHWVETKSTLIKKGYEPPITSLMMERLYDGTDMTEHVLTDEGLTLLLISHDLNKANVSRQENINKFSEYAMIRHHKFYCLTASPVNTINEFIENHNAAYEFLSTDDITLKTIIRSNPGLILLREGTILAKWHHNDIPEVSEIGEDLLAFALETQRLSHEKTRRAMYLLAFLFILSMAWNIRKSFK